MTTKHYIDDNGTVYGFEPKGIATREMSESEYQAYKHIQENPRKTHKEICELIHIERDRRWKSGFPIMHDDGEGAGERTYWLHSDPESVSHQDNAKALGSDLTTDRTWRTLDGSYVRMTPELAEKVSIARFDYKCQIFDAGENHQLIMTELDDPTDYDFSAGWPLSFEEWLAQQDTE